MIDERKLERAIAYGLKGIRPSSDLLHRIHRESAKLPTPNARSRPSLWTRLRLGQKLELAVACILFVGLVGLAAHRNINSGRVPLGAEKWGGTQGAITEPLRDQIGIGGLPLGDVVSVTRIMPGPAGERFAASMGDPEDQRQVIHLIAALADATPIDPSGADSDWPRARVGGLVLELRDGRQFTVKPALNCYSIEDDGLRCEGVPGKQLVTGPESHHRWVVASPELEQLLLKVEWPKPNYNRLTAGDVERLLREAGIDAVLSGEVPEDLSAFGVRGHAIKVGNETLQVYVFADEREQQSVTISSGGYAIGAGGRSTQVEWIAPPHVVREANIIVTLATIDERLDERVRLAISGPAMNANGDLGNDPAPVQLTYSITATSAPPQEQCSNIATLVPTDQTDEPKLATLAPQMIKKLYDLQGNDQFENLRVILASDAGVYGEMVQNWCGSTVAESTWVVMMTFPQYAPSASLSAGQFMVSKTQHGWQVWYRYH